MSLIVPQGTFNIPGTFLLHRMFFIVENILKMIKLLFTFQWNGSFKNFLLKGPTSEIIISPKNENYCLLLTLLSFQSPEISVDKIQEFSHPFAVVLRFSKSRNETKNILQTFPVAWFNCNQAINTSIWLCRPVSSLLRQVRVFVYYKQFDVWTLGSAVQHASVILVNAHPDLTHWWWIMLFFTVFWHAKVFRELRMFTVESLNSPFFTI